MKKQVILSGAAGQLGSSVLEQLVKSGYHVHGLVSPRRNPQSNDDITYHQVDLTDSEACKTLIDNISSSYKIDSAIFLAGGFAMTSIKDSTKDDFEKMMGINFFTALNLAQPIFKHMKQQAKGGSFVFVGAKSVLEGGGSGMFPYTVSKAAVIELSKNLHESGRQHNIRSAVVVPSIIDTPINRQSMPDANFDDWVSTEDLASQILHLIGANSASLDHTILKVYGNS